METKEFLQDRLLILTDYYKTLLKQEEAGNLPNADKKLYDLEEKIRELKKKLISF